MAANLHVLSNSDDDLTAKKKINANFTMLRSEFSSSSIGPELITIKKKLDALLDESEYEDPYNVVPTFSQQTLNTSSKLLIDDITVDEIHQSYVSNPSGGYTLTI